VAFLKNPQDALHVTCPEYTFECIFTPDSKVPLLIANCLHLYHFVGNFKLTKDDIFHHLVFLPTLCIPGLYYDWGYFGNWLALYVCGIPGCVDYFILAMQRIQKISNLNQKRISVNLNMWFRLPGILFAIGIAYNSFIHSDYNVPSWALIVQLVFLPTNVIFYAKQSIISYTLYSLKNKVKSDIDLKKIFEDLQ